MTPVQQVLQAAHFAAQKHAGQRRKGLAEEPYINHLIEIADLVASATSSSADTEVIVAALLHDCVEDVGVTKEELESSFGHAVAELVMEVTDDKSLPKAERKRLQIVGAPFKSRGAAMIKLADLTSNLRAIVNTPPVGWSQERKDAYGIWAGQVAGGLVSPNPLLFAKFEQARLSLLQRP